jgi:hypothetical protein
MNVSSANTNRPGRERSERRPHMAGESVCSLASVEKKHAFFQEDHAEPRKALLVGAGAPGGLPSAPIRALPAGDCPLKTLCSSISPDPKAMGLIF